MNRFRIASDVGVLDTQERVYVAHLPDGPIVVLEGPAAGALRVAVGSEGAAAESSVDRAEHERYTAALLDAGFIVEEDQHG